MMGSGVRESPGRMGSDPRMASWAPGFLLGDLCETRLVHGFSFLICEMGMGSSNASP